MLKMQMVFACDRFYKKPHPGRKYLVKFPRKLDPRKQRNGQSWDPGVRLLAVLVQACPSLAVSVTPNNAHTLPLPQNLRPLKLVQNCCSASHHCIFHSNGAQTSYAQLPVQKRSTAGWRTGLCLRGKLLSPLSWQWLSCHCASFHLHLTSCGWRSCTSSWAYWASSSHSSPSVSCCSSLCSPSQVLLSVSGSISFCL